MRKLDIAIAGAGPAGLAAALYLDRLGHRVTIFERFETPQPLGSGLILQPTGLSVLYDLGLWPEIARLGAPIDGLHGTDAASGRTVLDVRYAALRSGQRGLGVHRAALFGVLHRAVLQAGIVIVTGREVTGLAGRELHFAGRREGPFDLVVDCLGANSPLKAHARSRDRTSSLAYGALWATTPWVDAGFDPHGLTQRYRGAQVMIGVLPIGRLEPGGPQLAAFFWSLKGTDYDVVASAGFDAWATRVRDLWPETAPHIEAIGGFAEMTLAKYAHHTLAVPAGEGIAFVGDSAHATSPQLGQGANMALLDARAVYLALRDGTDVPDALDRYAVLRRWHVRLYQALSLMFTPFYQSDSRILPLIRDFAVPTLARIPPTPQLLGAMVAGTLLSPIKTLELGAPPLLENQAGMSGQT